jgi:hypothetical protein
MWHVGELLKLLFLVGLFLLGWFVTPGDAATHKRHVRAQWPRRRRMPPRR